MLWERQSRAEVCEGHGAGGCHCRALRDRVLRDGGSDQVLFEQRDLRKVRVSPEDVWGRVF